MEQNVVDGVDVQKLDRLMSLSGEMVIIRSQYARLEKLFQQDLVRQKGFAQGLERLRSLLDQSVRDPSRVQKALLDIRSTIDGLDELAGLEKMTNHIQILSHATSALEKAASALQAGILRVRQDATGGKDGISSGMAIIPALLVVVGEEVYAFPLSTVTEIVNVPKKDIYTVDGNATMKLRDHALSLMELANVIQAEPNVSVADDGVRRVVVITNGQDRLGVFVDDLLGKDEVVLKTLTRHFEGVKGIIGASILADGKVALILDSGVIIRESQ